MKIFQLDNTAIVFAEVNGSAVMTAVPADMIPFICEEKINGKDPYGNLRAEAAVQIAVEGEASPRGFYAGKTHRNSELCEKWGMPEFRFTEGEQTELVAEYRTAEGLTARQYFTARRGTGVIVTYCEVQNNSSHPVVLESVPSFLLTRLSPFVRYNDEAEVYVHKLRSYWSAEGMLESRPAREYLLEDSWSGLGYRGEKIGQLGTMPANGYLPWVAVEDKTNGVTWAVNLEAPASWQIEIANVYNAISLCGGLADFTYGHWKKNLSCGEKFRTRTAQIAVVKGNAEEAAQTLVRYSDKTEPVMPCERSLPVIYNEYCYSWGKPRMETVKRLLPVCKELGISYFVVDAGWYSVEGRYWDAVGDWEVNRSYFPDGLKGYADLCAEYGMRAGIWMEFENASTDTDLAREHPDWLLTCGGKPIRHGDRFMLDFRKQEVIAHLRHKVTEMLLKTGVRYIKIDYNESAGLGADGAESLGEGLRLHAEAVQAFYRSLRADIPDLVVEICSSGGMRHELSWLSLGGMCSFSDAHEGREGAVVACNLHRFIPPRKLQIWATIREDYGENETYFTLAKSMLGRMCLSGRLFGREEGICRILREAVSFYGEIKEIIFDGVTTEIKKEGAESFRSVRGVQTLTRRSSDGSKLLWYCFIMGRPQAEVCRGLPKGYRYKKSFGNAEISVCGGKITAKGAPSDWSGIIALLERTC